MFMSFKIEETGTRFHTITLFGTYVGNSLLILSFITLGMTV